MAKPYDLWHLSNPPPGATPCGEHGKLVASKTHGRGKRWRAAYIDPNGDPQTVAFELKGDAERFEGLIDACRNLEQEETAWEKLILLTIPA